MGPSTFADRLLVGSGGPARRGSDNLGKYLFSFSIYSRAADIRFLPIPPAWRPKMLHGMHSPKQFPRRIPKAPQAAGRPFPERFLGLVANFRCILAALSVAFFPTGSLFGSHSMHLMARYNSQEPKRRLISARLGICRQAGAARRIYFLCRW